MTERIIMGIDPGTNIMGYGVISVKGKEIEMLAMGVVQLNKFKNHTMKLSKIYKRTAYLIKEYKPDELAIEAPFYGKNVQSMLKLGRAQGVSMAAAIAKEVPVFEYAPKKIKQSITGSGSASKEQVAAMLKSILNIKMKPSYLDASDGLAAAVCHHLQGSIVSTNTKPAKKSSGWKNFLKENPNRVR